MYSQSEKLTCWVTNVWIFWNKCHCCRLWNFLAELSHKFIIAINPSNILVFSCCSVPYLKYFFTTIVNISTLPTSKRYHSICSHFVFFQLQVFIHVYAFQNLPIYWLTLYISFLNLKAVSPINIS